MPRGPLRRFRDGRVGALSVSHPLADWRTRAALVVAFLLLAALVVLVDDPRSHEDGRAQETGAGSGQAPLNQVRRASSTRFRAATFNVLGAGHTRPGGKHASYASGTQRMIWADRLIRNHDLDLVGFQEFEPEQFREFRHLEPTTWGVYPGNKLTNTAMRNSIAWRKDTWTLVEAHTMQVPYFHGNLVRMPYILLRNVHTGQLVWVYNSHNPADVRGPALKWRNRGFRLEAKLITSLRASYPQVPVITTGDKNDKANYFCPVIGATVSHAANGGTSVNGVCNPPSNMRIDWITGTPDVYYENYEALRNKLVAKTTDHALVMSDVIVPRSQVAPISKVVVISVEGLTSRALTDDPTQTPRLQQMMTAGAFTLNARTEDERTRTLPNVVGMLTGRRVNPRQGGHGVGWNATRYATVAAAAGHYVSSDFDLVHNLGLRTGLYSSAGRLSVIRDSWDATNGGADIYAPDNGRNKISQVVQTSTDSEAVDALDAQLLSKPDAFSYVHLRAVQNAGAAYGWGSERYYLALNAVDALLGKVVDTVASKASLRDHTLIIVTSDHGGSGTTWTNPDDPESYTVPILVQGPAVPAGGDLYALNPQYTDPGTARVPYTAPQPIRTADLANLVTYALGLPAVPGATSNPRQEFTVFAPATP